MSDQKERDGRSVLRGRNRGKLRPACRRPRSARDAGSIGIRDGAFYFALSHHSAGLRHRRERDVVCLPACHRGNLAGRLLCQPLRAPFRFTGIALHLHCETLPPIFGVAAAWGLLLAYLATAASVAGGALYYTNVLSLAILPLDSAGSAHSCRCLRLPRASSHIAMSSSPPN